MKRGSNKNFASKLKNRSSPKSRGGKSSRGRGGPSRRGRVRATTTVSAHDVFDIGIKTVKFDHD
jgi:hypothetical protein